MTPEGAPDLLLSTGNLDRQDDQAELDVLDELWPGPRPLIASLDGQLGHACAAALPLNLVLAALMLARGRPLIPQLAWSSDAVHPRLLREETAPILGPLRRIVVSASDPEGGLGAVALRRMDE
jgi:hypothetical protein